MKPSLPLLWNSFCYNKWCSKGYLMDSPVSSLPQRSTPLRETFVSDLKTSQPIRLAPADWSQMRRIVFFPGLNVTAVSFPLLSPLPDSSVGVISPESICLLLHFTFPPFFSCTPPRANRWEAAFSWQQGMRGVKYKLYGWFFCVCVCGSEESQKETLFLCFCRFQVDSSCINLFS